MSNMRKFSSLLLIPIIISLSLGLNANPATFAETDSTESEPFTDIQVGNQYYVAINYLQEHGIIEGYEDNTFKPSQNIDRAESLKMLTLATGVFSEEELTEIESDTVTTTDTTDSNTDQRPFQDTPPSEWYTKYLIAAKEKGIINGYPDGTFKPWLNINLAEALKIFLEAYEKSNGYIIYENIEENLVDDTPANEWFTKYSSYAISKGLINIYSTNTINTTQFMTRGYLAEIIYRMQKSVEGYQFGKATWYSGITEDSGNTLTTAHKELPFGTVVEVTNLANGKSINVVVNDRGPYGPGRVLDLSSEAFSQIAALGTGIIYVQYRIVLISTVP